MLTCQLQVVMTSERTEAIIPESFDVEAKKLVEASNLVNIIDPYLLEELQTNIVQGMVLKAEEAGTMDHKTIPAKYGICGHPLKIAKGEDVEKLVAEHNKQNEVIEA